LHLAVQMVDREFKTSADIIVGDESVLNDDILIEYNYNPL